MNMLVRRIDMALESTARGLLPLLKHITSMLREVKRRNIVISSKGENVGGMDAVDVTGKTTSTSSPIPMSYLLLALNGIPRAPFLSLFLFVA